ncbi:hypothetical protein T492DRAFT_324992 [Pavlovales sp. CCMP2436]|nr:hypothetical protein T492DRAFT_324992 [Pavlovales sp. CCMP2436]
MLVHGVGPGLVCVETVDRLKVAKALNQAVASSLTRSKIPLGIMLQVNTSGEDSKSGCDPAEAPGLAKEIVDSCPHLTLAGLMTIGAPRELAPEEDDPDFVKLAEVRQAVAGLVGVPPDSLELSMGMSGDWERAIRQGSTSVRVGSAIFGARSYPA